jgi:hypothetical protein
VGRLLCRLGIHNWLTIRCESPAYLRCLERNKAQGKYCGIVTCLGNWVVDRECLRCGKQDFRIEAAIKKFAEEEKLIAKRLKELEVKEVNGG